MSKIDDKWFKDHGFSEYIHEETNERNNACQEKVYCRTITYEKFSSKDITSANKWCRYTHVYKKVTDKFGLVSIRNWYSFYGCGNGFKIENNICFKKFDIEQIEGAIKVIGLK